MFDTEFDNHSWANQMYDLGAMNPKKAQTNREGWRKKMMEWLICYKKGKPSPEGQALVNMLKRECKFVGFSPCVTYMMEKPRRHGSWDDMRAQWVHPFGSPTMLFFHKKYPIAILANPNLRFDETVLSEIDKNRGLREMRNLLGITG